MDNSIFLAKFWGWYLIIFFMILSFNPKRIKQIFNDLEDEKFLIISSFMAINVGLLNVLFHNIWEPNWKLIITLIGWISLYIGLSLFILPKRTTAVLKFINIKLVQVIYTLLFLIGLFLLNIVYEIVPI
ncbi:MAG: hypothetical protein P8K68_08750 [Algibacter sp.]|uniref:hypothetical protein n=1 Tax=Algibacter sp. TaxID=1872428 RepID=UPI002605A629|nr:hypothetical protein [Algibacter sp.]MDG1730382.1 hypothetical protein [Algibacter sp.]MDG2178860.1 hypothetical protein [Algibacter sp.]